MKISKYSDILLLFIFAASCDVGNEHGYGPIAWEEFDLDSDRVVDEAEFSESWNKRNEFTAWDENGNGRLSQAEWEESHNLYYQDWDSELYGYYEDWDLNQDGEVDDKEMASKTFQVWDSNGNGKIEQEEFDAWNTPKE